MTPETLDQYIPNLPTEILTIEEIAHKADMIRALLVYHHGGMWLDSDAIVLSHLNWLFDLLSDCDFVGFNNTGSFTGTHLQIRINCFLSRPKSEIMKSWVNSQHKKFPKTKFAWTEVGTDLLDPIVIENQNTVKLLPFDMICPIKWNEVERFSSTKENSRRILRNTHVMLSNKSLQQRNPQLAKISLIRLSEDGTLIGDIIKKAIDTNYEPPSYFEKIIRNITRKSS